MKYDDRAWPFPTNTRNSDDDTLNRALSLAVLCVDGGTQAWAPGERELTMARALIYLDAQRRGMQSETVSISKAEAAQILKRWTGDAPVTTNDAPIIAKLERIAASNPAPQAVPERVAEHGHSLEEGGSPASNGGLAVAGFAESAAASVDDIDRSYSLSLADAVENCRVTCKHEPSAFDLEQQGYDTIIRALRAFGSRSATTERTDAERLNWLERKVVNVRRPALYG